MIKEKPEVPWSNVEETSVNVADRLCPVKSFRIRKDRPDSFTKGIIETIRKRDALFREAREANTMPRHRELWQEAVQKRKKVKVQLKKAK